MPLLVNREIRGVDSYAGPIAFSEYLELDDAAQASIKSIRANGEDSLDQLLLHSSRFDLIALEFPIIRDGRSFSIARELRVAGFGGQIRAVGETSRDKLQFLERCGFDAVELDDEHFRREFLEAYTEISVQYQGAVDQPLPIYRQQETTA